MDSKTFKNFKITVSKAEGSKCPRCWRVVKIVSNLGICERCTVACQEDGWIRPGKDRGTFELTEKWDKIDE